MNLPAPRARKHRSRSFSPLQLPFFKSKQCDKKETASVSSSSNNDDQELMQSMVEERRAITPRDSVCQRPPRRSSHEPEHLNACDPVQAQESSWTSNQQPFDLTRAQKQGCFNYIKRRHSIALAFASNEPSTSAEFAVHDACQDNQHEARCEQNSTVSGPGSSESTGAFATNGSNWELFKTRQGVQAYRSKRSRCEVRAVTHVNASVKNVMSLLAAGDSSDAFAYAQKVLLGDDQVLEARTLASCVPSSASRYFHCGLKYLALKNPFGVYPLDLVFLDYTDVTTTHDKKLIGYRIMESIRVPELRAVPKYTRASIRCEVYVVRETATPGVVEVIFASHMDPKSKYTSSKRTAWIEQAIARLTNLRSYAEKASFSHRLVLEKSSLIKGEARRRCVICDFSFNFLRKRHNCRLCGEVTCGRCSRKLPILVGTDTARVRVCLGCILQSRQQPDELGMGDLDYRPRRGSLSHATFIVHDESDDDEQPASS